MLASYRQIRLTDNSNSFCGKTHIFFDFLPIELFFIIIAASCRQIDGKLNQAQYGRYFIYLGAVSGSSGLIALCATASLIKREILPAEVVDSQPFQT